MCAISPPAQDVPHQIVKLDGARHLRILASDVPSAGYKVFEILPGAGAAPTDEAATVSGDGGSTFENGAVKLVIERDGAIRSFIDKRRGNTELAATIGELKLNDFAAEVRRRRSAPRGEPRPRLRDGARPQRGRSRPHHRHHALPRLRPRGHPQRDQRELQRRALLGLQLRAE